MLLMEYFDLLISLILSNASDYRSWNELNYHTANYSEKQYKIIKMKQEIEPLIFNVCIHLIILKYCTTCFLLIYVSNTDYQIIQKKKEERLNLSSKSSTFELAKRLKNINLN